MKKKVIFLIKIMMFIPIICVSGFSFVVVSFSGYCFWKSCQSKKKKEEPPPSHGEPIFYKDFTNYGSHMASSMQRQEERRCDQCGNPCQIQEYSQTWRLFQCNHIFHRSCIIYKTAREGFDVCNICK